MKYRMFPLIKVFPLLLCSLEQALASRDEAAARWLGSFYWRLDTWPARPAAEQEGTYFIVSQAKLWRVGSWHAWRSLAVVSAKVDRVRFCAGGHHEPCCTHPTELSPTCF